MIDNQTSTNKIDSEDEIADNKTNSSPEKKEDKIIDTTVVGAFYDKLLKTDMKDYFAKVGKDRFISSFDDTSAVGEFYDRLLTSRIKNQFAKIDKQRFVNRFLTVKKKEISEQPAPIATNFVEKASQQELDYASSLNSIGKIASDNDIDLSKITKKNIKQGEEYLSKKTKESVKKELFELKGKLFRHKGNSEAYTKYSDDYLTNSWGDARTSKIGSAVDLWGDFSKINSQFDNNEIDAKTYAQKRNDIYLDLFTYEQTTANEDAVLKANQGEGVSSFLNSLAMGVGEVVHSVDEFIGNAGIDREEYSQVLKNTNEKLKDVSFANAYNKEFEQTFGKDGIYADVHNNEKVLAIKEWKENLPQEVKDKLASFELTKTGEIIIPELSESEKLYKKAIETSYDINAVYPLDKTNYSQVIGGSIGQSLEFMAEIMGTGGISPTAKLLTKASTTQAVKFIEKVGARLAKGGEIARKTIQETGIQTAKMPSMYINAGKDYTSGKKTFTKALGDSYYNTFLSLLSERLSTNSVEGVPTKELGGGLTQFFNKVGFKTGKGFKNKIASIIEEYLEEKFEDVGQGIKDIVIDNGSLSDNLKKFNDLKQNVITLTTVGAMGGFSTISDHTNNLVNVAKVNIEYNRVAKRLDNDLQADIDIAFETGEDLDEINSTVIESIVNHAKENGTTSKEKTQIINDGVKYIKYKSIEFGKKLGEKEVEEAKKKKEIINKPEAEITNETSENNSADEIKEEVQATEQQGTNNKEEVSKQDTEQQTSEQTTEQETTEQTTEQESETNTEKETPTQEDNTEKKPVSEEERLDDLSKFASDTTKKLVEKKKQQIETDTETARQEEQAKADKILNKKNRTIDVDGEEFRVLKNKKGKTVVSQKVNGKWEYVSDPEISNKALGVLENENAQIAKDVEEKVAERKEAITKSVNDEVAQYMKERGETFEVKPPKIETENKKKPVEPVKSRFKLPSAIKSSSGVVDKFRALKESLRSHERGSKLGAKEMDASKQIILDEIQKKIKDNEIKKINRGHVNHLISAVKKANPKTIEATLNYVENEFRKINKSESITGLNSKLAKVKKRLNAKGKNKFGTFRNIVKNLVGAGEVKFTANDVHSALTDDEIVEYNNLVTNAILSKNNGDYNSTKKRVTELTDKIKQHQEIKKSLKLDADIVSDEVIENHSFDETKKKETLKQIAEEFNLTKESKNGEVADIQEAERIFNKAKTKAVKDAVVGVKDWIVDKAGTIPIKEMNKAIDEEVQRSAKALGIDASELQKKIENLKIDYTKIKNKKEVTALLEILKDDLDPESINGIEKKYPDIAGLGILAEKVRDVLKNISANSFNTVNDLKDFVQRINDLKSGNITDKLNQSLELAKANNIINDSRKDNYLGFFEESNKEIKKRDLFFKKLFGDKTLKVYEGKSTGSKLKKIFNIEQKGALERARRYWTKNMPNYMLGDILNPFSKKGSEKFYSEIYSIYSKGTATFEREFKRISSDVKLFYNNSIGQIKLKGVNDNFIVEVVTKLAQLQEEITANKLDYTVKDVVKVASDAVESNKYDNYHSPDDIKVINELVEMFTDSEGNIDVDKIKNYGDGSYGKLIDYMDEISENELLNKLAYSTMFDIGDKFDIIEKRAHRVTAKAIADADKQLPMGHKSALENIKASSAHSRVSKISVMSMLGVNSFMQDVSDVLYEHHVGGSAREISALFKNIKFLSDSEVHKLSIMGKDVLNEKLEKREPLSIADITDLIKKTTRELTGKERDHAIKILNHNRDLKIRLSIVEDIINETKIRELGSSLMRITGVHKIMHKIITETSSSVLARPFRMVDETLSNIAPLISTAVFSKDVGTFTNSSLYSDYSDVLSFTKSPIVNRFSRDQFYENNIKGNYSKYSSKHSKSSIWGKISDLTDSNIIGDAKAKINEKMIGTPDKVVGTLLWKFNFNRRFKSETGEVFNLKKFKEDKGYVEKHRKAIMNAGNYSDLTNDALFGSSTRADGIIDITYNQSVSGGSILNRINNLFRSFVANDYRQAVKALEQIMVSQYSMNEKGQAVQTLTGIYIRQAVYAKVGQLLSALSISLINAMVDGASRGDDDDDFLKKFTGSQSWDNLEHFIKKEFTIGELSKESVINAITIPLSKYGMISKLVAFSALNSLEHKYDQNIRATPYTDEDINVFSSVSPAQILSTGATTYRAFQTTKKGILQMIENGRVGSDILSGSAVWNTVGGATGLADSFFGIPFATSISRTSKLMGKDLEYESKVKRYALSAFKNKESFDKGLTLLSKSLKDDGYLLPTSYTDKDIKIFVKALRLEGGKGYDAIKHKQDILDRMNMGIKLYNDYTQNYINYKLIDNASTTQQNLFLSPKDEDVILTEIKNKNYTNAYKLSDNYSFFFDYEKMDDTFEVATSDNAIQWTTFLQDEYVETDTKVELIYKNIELKLKRFTEEYKDVLPKEELLKGQEKIVSNNYTFFYNLFKVSDKIPLKLIDNFNSLDGEVKTSSPRSGIINQTLSGKILDVKRKIEDNIFKNEYY